MMETDDALAALHAVQDMQKKAASRAQAPAWYHVSLGIIMATMIASIDAPRAGGAIVAAALCMLAVIVSRYQKQTGTWLNGFTAGSRRARGTMIFGIVVIAVVLVTGLWFKFHQGVEGAMLVTGAAIGLFAIWLGFAWERAFLRDAGATR